MAVADVKYCFENLLYRKILYSPLKKSGFVPEKDTEIFVSAIPNWITVYDLARFFERVGELYQVKLLVEPDGIHNRGIAFVTYMNAKLAQRAMDELGSKPFFGTKCLYIQRSVNNCRIFVGGLPTSKTKDEIWQELIYAYGIRNIVDVITYRNYSNLAHNRGFVFLEFRTHEEASFFRAKYAGKLELFGQQLLVDWSVPVLESDERMLSQVKIIFLKNLNVTLASEEFAGNIYKLINRAHVEKVYKFKNYAFVHLDTRKNAEILLNILSRLYKDTVVEVSWAKPPNKFTERSFRDKTLLNRRSRASCDTSSTTRPQLNSATCSSHHLSELSRPLSHSHSRQLPSPPSNTMTNPHVSAASEGISHIRTPATYLESGNRQKNLLSQNIFNNTACGTSTRFAVDNQSWNRTCGNIGMTQLPQNLEPFSLSQCDQPVYELQQFQTPKFVLNRTGFSTPCNSTGFRTSTPSRLWDPTTRSTGTSSNSGITTEELLEAMVNNLLIDEF